MTSVNLLSNILQDYQLFISSGNASKPAAAEQSNTSDSSGKAYILDLSQAAQEILAQNGVSGTISLSDSQKQKLQSILDKYKDAPIDNDTLSALYTDLKQAGLDPNQLANTQEARNFNTSAVFLQLLGAETQDDVSPTDSTLSILGSTATKSPIGKLQDTLLSFSQNF